MSYDRINSRFGDTIEERIYQDGKVGGASGWAVRAAANSWMSTVAASQTGATLVIPLHGLKKGDRIVGYHLLGQIESGGNTASLNCKLVRGTPVAADSDFSDIPGTSMTQLSAAADKAIVRANTYTKFKVPVVVDSDHTYMAQLTATTGSGTDIQLLGLVLHVEPLR